MEDDITGGGERPRGVLTREDRAYLRGETDYEYSQSEINTRRRIRERIYHTLLDGYYLFHGMDADDRRQIFDPRFQPRIVENEDSQSIAKGMEFADEGSEQEWSRTKKAIENWLAFLYIGVDERPLVGRRVFDSLLEGAVRQVVERQHGFLDEFELTINVRRNVSNEELLEMFEANEVLSHEELAYLFKSGLVGEDDFLKAVRERNSGATQRNYDSGSDRH